MVRVAIVVLAVLLLPAAAHAKRVALVVGINKYDNLPRERQLAKAVNDARAMEAALKLVGFDVVKAEDVGRSAFNQAWQQLLNKVSPGDEVAVFFSGHGVEIEGVNYLIPRDVPAVGSGETRRLKNESLSFDEIRRDLAAHGPKLSLFILDACRDNPFTDTRGRSIGGSKGLVPVQAEQGSFIMFAAGAREMALDRLSDTDADPNSIYTRKLLPLLKQPGLRLPDVAQRVRGEVRQLANTVSHRQNPAYYDEGADDVCLAGCAVTPASPIAPAPASEAAEAWDRVKETTIVAVLEAFIARYRDTFYAELARARVKELGKTAKSNEAAAPPPPKMTIEQAREKAEEARKRVEALRGKSSQSGERVAVATPQASPAPARCDGVEALVGNERRCLKPKESFKDCPECPEMVVVPSGEFTMGSPPDEAERQSNEDPQHKVTIAKPFGVGKYEVTFAEWDACEAAGGCKLKPNDYGWGGGKRPMIDVSWDDGKEYVSWLAKKTGRPYRLLSEAEWEYAARAGTATAFSTGRTITTDQANFHGDHTDGGSAKGVYRGKTIEVGSLNKPNAFGLHDMHGNVWEWVEDCYKDTYAGAPSDGRASSAVPSCSRVVRGGSWVNIPRYLRSAKRGSNGPDYRSGLVGFRVARTLSAP